MGRNFLKGRLGNQVNTVMSAVGYNFRLILKWLRNFLCLIASGIIEAFMPFRTTKAAAW